MKSTITLMLVLLTLIGPASAQESVEDFGKYQVRYAVFPSTFLPQEVAESNNLTRSKGIGVVNIAITTDSDNGQPETVSGQVEGKVLNDVRQAKFLGFRRIQEGEAVYFVAQYQYRSGELMTFQITARPTGHNEDLPIRFSQTLFND